MNPVSKLIDSAKLRIAEALWTFPRRMANDVSLREKRQTLLEEGCCIIENFFDAATVQALVAEATDVYQQESQFVSLESNGADQRIYGVDRLRSAFVLEDPMAGIDQLSNDFYGRTSVWFQVLGKIRHTPNNLGSGSGWHRDSPFSHQFKAILYLTDVDTDNGPFQFIPGTHLKKSIERACGFLGIAATQYRFNGEQIERLENMGVVPRRVSVTGPRGTLLLADSRCLHRGAPLQSGERMALTRYYFSRAVPAEFQAQYPLTAKRRDRATNIS